MRALQSPAVARIGFLLPAAFVFLLAYDGGGYSSASRATWAIGVWWLLAVGIALGASPLRRGSPAASAVAALLAALALLTLASAMWSTNDADAVSEFNRVAFYLGAFLLVLLLLPRLPVHRWLDGLALGLSAVAATALLSRLAPGLISDRGLAEALPAGAARLSHPVGYWNGLAILVALAVPLLLRASVSHGHPIQRALWVAPLPAIVATIYLASSRGGVATAAAGAISYLVLSRFRWRVAGAILAAAAGSAVALAALLSYSDLVDDPAASSSSTRVMVGLALLLACVVALAVHAVLATIFSGRSAPRWLGIAAAAVAVAAALAAAAVADPVERLRTFKQPPPEGRASDDFVRSHLVSAGGSGRWQFWEAAVDAWQSKPLLGHGAGSYEAWWAQHGSLAVFVRDAHSLYLETLAELGLIGFALLAAALVAGVVVALRNVRRFAPPRADAVAAAIAVVLAYVVAAGIDWMWELPVVTLVALACLAVAVAPEGSASRPWTTAARAGFVAAAIAVVAAQAIPYLSELRLRDSQAAAAGGDYGAALASARDARALQPWSPDPWLQLALVHEQRGELAPARRAIERAIREDAGDWRLWLVAARLQTRSGEIAGARRSLDRAIELNPRSPLFANLR